jgi:hypothetical protein
MSKDKVKGKAKGKPKLKVVESNHTRTQDQQVFSLFNQYRCYITIDSYLITFRDQDLLTIYRRGLQAISQDPGFLLLTVEIFLAELQGKRTSIRDRWALLAPDYRAKAQELDLKCRATHGRVLEFWFEKSGVKAKLEDL